MCKAFKVDTTWIVEVPDDNWFGVTTDKQRQICAEAAQQAKIEGCVQLSIFAQADAIFPLYGHEGLKLVHNEKLANAQSDVYEIHTTYRAVILEDEWRNTPENLKHKLVRKVRDTLNSRGETFPGRYEICVGAGNNLIIIERGRV